MNWQIPRALVKGGGLNGREVLVLAAVSFGTLLPLAALFWFIGPGGKAYIDLLQPIFGVRIESYQAFSPETLYLLYAFPISLIISVIPPAIFFNRRLLSRPPELPLIDIKRKAFAELLSCAAIFCIMVYAMTMDLSVAGLRPTDKAALFMVPIAYGFIPSLICVTALFAGRAIMCLRILLFWWD